jgi:hypothetical protein
LEIIAHESAHAALSIAEWHKLPISGDDDLQEPVAYLVGFVTAQVHDAIKRHRGLTRRKK